MRRPESPPCLVDRMCGNERESVNCVACSHVHMEPRAYTSSSKVSNYNTINMSSSRDCLVVFAVGREGVSMECMSMEGVSMQGVGCMHDVMGTAHD